MGLVLRLLGAVECQAAYGDPPVLTTLVSLNKQILPPAKGEVPRLSIAIHQIQCRLHLHVVVGKSTCVVEILPSEDEPLLVRQDILILPSLKFHHLERVGRFDLLSNRLADLYEVC